MGIVRKGGEDGGPKRLPGWPVASIVALTIEVKSAAECRVANVKMPSATMGLP